MPAAQPRATRRAASSASATRAGYWGDDPFALRRQLLGPTRLDYVSIDFLAELSMSILQKQRAKDPTAGWARDFLGADRAAARRAQAAAARAS